MISIEKIDYEVVWMVREIQHLRGFVLVHDLLEKIKEELGHFLEDGSESGVDENVNPPDRSIISRGGKVHRLICELQATDEDGVLPEPIREHWKFLCRVRDNESLSDEEWCFEADIHASRVIAGINYMLSGIWSDGRSPSEWAKFFGRNWRTIKRYIESGDLRCQKVSTKYYKFHKDDIRRLSDDQIS